MDEEELLKMRSADRAAGTMFNLFPQGMFQSLGQAFQRSFSNPQSGTMMAGSAGVNPMMAGNIPQFPRLGPLVRTDYGLPPSERPEWRNPADQWDARPVKTAPPEPQFVGTDPRAATPDDMDYFYGRGKYAANQPAKQTVAATAPQPAKSAAKPTATIQTPYGTVKATADQLQYDSAFKDDGQSFWAAGTMAPQSARLANIGEQAQRSAAIAQMRERGTALAQQRLGAQEAFFAQRRAERGALARAESAARASGVGSMDIMRARETVAGPSSIAGIQRQSTIGPMSPVPTTVARFAGALPPAGARTPVASMSPYSNERSERRRRTRQVAEGQGMQPAYSLPIQEAQEDYFRRRGMI